MRIERLLAAGASIKGTARKFEIDPHALRRHWITHVSTEVRAGYVAGAGATKDQLEEIVADESFALIDHNRIVRGALYKAFGAASEIGDSNSLALLAGRLHENFRDLRPPDRRAAARSLVECSEQYFGQSRQYESDRPDRERGGALSGRARGRDCG